MNYAIIHAVANNQQKRGEKTQTVSTPTPARTPSSIYLATTLRGQIFNITKTFFAIDPSLAGGLGGAIQ